MDWIFDASVCAKAAAEVLADMGLTELHREALDLRFALERLHFKIVTTPAELK